MVRSGSITFCYFAGVFVCVLCQTTVPCVTPNGESAQCVSFLRCPLLAGAIASGNDTQIDFVRQSVCGLTQDNKESLLCCGSEKMFKDRSANKPQNARPVPSTTPRTDLFPSKKICGYQARDDRFENRNFTVLDEFPWLALLNYSNGHYSKVDGFGTIINRRYILTSAQVLLKKDFNLTNVRLGEYNPNSEGEDCLENPDYPECSDPVVDIAIEEIIPHPEYDHMNRYNDIGLIRLKQPITFTNFIRPLCLPTPDVKMAVPGDALITTGWEEKPWVAHGERLRHRKKKGTTELITLGECKTKMEVADTIPKIIESQLCSKDKGPEYICYGDLGSPAMFVNGIQWHVEGVVSYSYSCGPGTIEVLTKVTSYLDWIYSNVRP